MKKIILIFFLTMAFICSAQEDSTIVLDTRLQYGYNATYHHYGVASVLGRFKVANNIQLAAGLSANTSQLYSGTASGRILFDLGRDMSLHIENTYLYRAYVCYNSGIIDATLLVGFQMNHFRVSLGNDMRFISPLHLNHVHGIHCIGSPFNLLYQIEGRVCKESSYWNLGLRISNYRWFDIERSHEPTLALTSYYQPKKSLRLVGECGLEPSGAFNLAVNSYEYYLQLGVEWLW